jgi:hypothetical protein
MELSKRISLPHLSQPRQLILEFMRGDQQFAEERRQYKKDQQRSNNDMNRNVSRSVDDMRRRVSTES